MLLKLFSLIYLSIINIRNFLYDHDWLKTQRLSTTVVSIGNIIVGGSGKTPITIYLAQSLIEKGYSVGIVCRGYKKKSKGTIIVSDGVNILSNVNACGDEAYLIAKNVFKSYIVADENKTRAAIFIEKQFKPDIILIDDGFQHRRLERNVDILLYNTRIKSSKYKLLPLGILREPIKNINRCDILINTYDKDSKLKLNSSIKKYFSKMNYELKLVCNDEFISCIHPKEAIAFSGIANPIIFFNQLKKYNIKIKKELAFKDHVEYSDALIKKIDSSINNHYVKSVITTEKDFVKLPLHFVKKVDIYILCMNVKIDKCDSLISEIEYNFIKLKQH